MTFREYVESLGMDEIHNIVDGGCASGVSGLTYYQETQAVYKEHGDEIWDTISDEAESCGFKSVLDFVVNTGADEHNHTREQFENTLVWLAVEIVATELDDR